jgi:predicted MFS family arabinose efflux permease
MSASAIPPAVSIRPPHPAVPVAGPGHRLRLTLLMAGSCLPILGAVLISPVLPKIKDHFATVPGADALVPLVLTIPALSLAILAPFAGVIVDRLGRKRLLIWATLAYAVFGTAPLWLAPLGAILASRALVGIAEAAIMTCCTTLIGDYYSGRQRDKYLAMQTMCASLSATAFFAIGGATGSAGWRAPFWIYAVSLILAPAMAAYLPQPAVGVDKVMAHGAEKRPFPFRALWTTCLLTVFGAMVFYTVPVELPFLLDALGVKATGVIGLAAALASAATVAGAVSFSRLGPERVRLALVFAVCGAGFAVMWLGQVTVVLVVGAVINCIGTGLLLPALLTRAMSRLDFADRGRGTGLWLAAFFGGEFVCPLVLLALKAAVGTLAAAVGLLGAAAAALAVSLFLLGKRSKSQIPAS